MSVKPARQSLGSVLVVGGCGFLGHHVVKQLVQYHQTTAIAVLDLRTVRNRMPESDGVRYFDGDITSIPSITPAFTATKPDVVIHTASPVLMEKDRELMQRVNVDGTKNLVAVAGKFGVKAFVYTSSASVISDNTSDLLHADERWPLVARKFQDENDFYTLTKADAEQHVLTANRAHNKMLTVALRPAGIIGEGDVQNMVNVVGAYKKGLTNFQLGDNDNLWDFTYVANAAHACVLASVALLKTSTAWPSVPLDHERVDGEAFFITNDAPVYFWDYARAVWALAGDKTGLNVWVISKDFGLFVGGLLEAILGAVGRTPNLTRKQVRFSSFARYYNIDKAKSRLGYAPIVGLEEGIKRGYDWLVEQERGKAEEKTL
ncbi:MAG: erg26, C-3 sterol dehydrogenase [Thelocarpon superellum]|nr:MAG: erg26, C-3 sterol dehydrogenase [Thelocarpon superellum]